MLSSTEALRHVLSVLSQAATVLLVPPANLAALALLGLALAPRRPALGRGLAVGSLVALLLLALPAVSVPLLVALERGTDPVAGGPAPQAIVILGGEVAPAGPLADQIDVGALTLERLRGGAALARASGLPVLATGGLVGAAGPPVAVLMARSLAEDFAVPARWVEPASRTTWENARFSAAILRREGIGAVLLVTHPWHMRRALIAFRAAGLTAVPAPLPADRMPRFVPADFVPQAASWQRSYYALHEWLGGAWYAWQAGHAEQVGR